VSAEDLERFGDRPRAGPVQGVPGRPADVPLRSSRPPAASTSANGYHLDQHENGGDTWFELTLTDAWVWDVYRPTRFVTKVAVRTFRDVNIEELKHPDRSGDPLGRLTD